MAEISDEEFERWLEEHGELVADWLLALPPSERPRAARRFVAWLHDLVVSVQAEGIENATVDSIVRAGRG